MKDDDLVLGRSNTRCLDCLHPYHACVCTKEETEAWLKDKEEEDAYYAKLLEEEQKKRLRPAQDDYADLGHRSYPAHLMAWEAERQRDG